MASLGAYLFSFLQLMGIYFEGWLPTVSVQVFQVAPFPLGYRTESLQMSGLDEAEGENDCLAWFWPVRSGVTQNHFRPTWQLLLTPHV